MPVHDWTRVEYGIFHAFHVAWLPEIQRCLNDGLLPEGYYALAEQHVGPYVGDILTLHTSPANGGNGSAPGPGGTALAQAPPKTRRRQTIEPVGLVRRRSIAVRHVSEHRLVAFIEIVSPANKDRKQHVDEFTAKVVSALDQHVHVLIVDLFPPGKNDPRGLHEIIMQRLAGTDDPYDLPIDEPLTLASYASGTGIEAFVEHLAIANPLPEMPLFLRPDRYINVPLDTTYQSAYRGVPAFWRAIIESKSSA
jgi:hypothetical protein